MSSHPAPTREDHQAFCVIEGWALVRGATGKPLGHHVTYELGLPDGRILRTRVSRPPDKTTYGRRLWGVILREQLDVDEDIFWKCVHHKTLPERGTPPPPEHTIPAELFHLLVRKVGIPERRVLDMTKAEAVEAATQYWMSDRATTPQRWVRGTVPGALPALAAEDAVALRRDLDAVDVADDLETDPWEGRE